MTLTLPDRLQRANIRAFCLAGGVTVAGVVAFAVGFRTGLQVFLGLMPFIVVGLLRPKVARLVYRVWNKAAKSYSVAAEWVLVRLCFACVVRVVALAGARQEFAPPKPSSSFWTGRVVPLGLSYPRQDDLSRLAGSDAWWPITLATWAWRSGNLWVVGLLPFLLVLAALNREAEDAGASEIYTLF